MGPKTRGGIRRERIEAETQPVVEPPNEPSPPPVVVTTRMEPSPPAGVVDVQPTRETSLPAGVVEATRETSLLAGVVEATRDTSLSPGEVRNEDEIRSGEGDSEEEEEEEDDEDEGKDGDSEEEEEEEEGKEGDSEEEGKEGDSEEGEKDLEEGEENNSNDSVETSAIPPMGMYFPPSEYNKKIKISTRCYISEVLETLDNLKPPLDDMERDWFEKHRQFKHIFHMPKDNNHKVMGMWLLLLRTVETEKEKEAWFGVNGAPI